MALARHLSLASLSLAALVWVAPVSAQPATMFEATQYVTGFDEGPQDGVFDSLTSGYAGVTNNGWTSLRGAVTFDLTGIPRPAPLASVTLSVLICVGEGNREVVVHGFGDDGVVQLADFSRDAPIASLSLLQLQCPTVNFDVTSLVESARAAGLPSLAIVAREEPANAPNFLVMYLSNAWLHVEYTTQLSVWPASLSLGGRRTASGTVTSETPAQGVTVLLSPAVALEWTAIGVPAWLVVSDGSGAGVGTFTVSVNRSHVFSSEGTFTGAVTVSAAGTANGAISLPVSIRVRNTTAAPFGQVDTPTQGASGLQGAVGVTGWALDDTAVDHVWVYRNCLSFDVQANCQSIDGRRLVFVSEAKFLAGARPDVEGAYPTWPQAHRAGWGALILTNMLPNVPAARLYGGQGGLTLYCYAVDVEGRRTLLGRSAADHAPTRITMANNTIAKPFETIDTPANGEAVSGVVANFGWSLTPDADVTPGNGDIDIPSSGSTMVVFLDGLPVSLVAYDQCRGSVGNPVPGGVFCDDDISNLFGAVTPQAGLTPRTANPTRFRNLDAGRGAIGAYVLDTTELSNGLHTLAWSVTDSAGRVEGVGSRFFRVLNGASSDAASAAPAVLDPVVTSGSSARADSLPTRADVRAGSVNAVADGAEVAGTTAAVAGLPVALTPVWLRTGYDHRRPLVELRSDRSGRRTARVPQGGRIELAFAGQVDAAFSVQGPILRSVPVGASVSEERNRFAWTPPPGYLGIHDLLFVVDGARMPVRVVVEGAEAAGRPRKESP